MDKRAIEVAVHDELTRQLAVSRHYTAHLHGALKRLLAASKAELLVSASGARLVAESEAALATVNEPALHEYTNDFRQCAKDALALAELQHGGEPLYAQRVLEMLGEGE